MVKSDGIKLGIYIILNELTNKVYIGQSNDIKKRWMSHRSKLKMKKHSCAHLQASWNKGVPCSEETKKQMSASRKGQPAINRTSEEIEARVISLFETLNISQNKISELLNVPSSTVSVILKRYRVTE